MDDWNANPQLSQLSTQKNSSLLPSQGWKADVQRDWGMVGVVATPTILLPSLLLCNMLRNNLAEVEISWQYKGSYLFPHLLPLRIKIATIKGKYIFLGRENFLAGLLVKSPCCQHSANYSGKSEAHCEIYLLPLKILRHSRSNSRCMVGVTATPTIL